MGLNRLNKAGNESADNVVIVAGDGDFAQIFGGKRAQPKRKTLTCSCSRSDFPFHFEKCGPT